LAKNNNNNNYKKNHSSRIYFTAKSKHRLHEVFVKQITKKDKNLIRLIFQYQYR